MSQTDGRDVQNMQPAERFKINRVGVVGVKKPVHVVRNGVEHVLSATIDVAVDLPPTQKGSHMSRNAEVINEVLDRSVRGPCHSLEDVALVIASNLLERHDYARRAEVSIEADYFMERRTPLRIKTYENYGLIAHAYKERGGKERKAIGVRVTGMTACPCAMEEVKTLYSKRHGIDISHTLGTGAFITHNQRNITTLIIETRSDCDVEAEDLIELVEKSLSSPTYEILKRKDEAMVVLNAHENPMFVEDVVRSILKKVLDRYSHLPGDTLITVRSESEESIHKHNAFAERVTTLEELKR